MRIKNKEEIMIPWRNGKRSLTPKPEFPRYTTNFYTTGFQDS